VKGAGSFAVGHTAYISGFLANRSKTRRPGPKAVAALWATTAPGMVFGASRLDRKLGPERAKTAHAWRSLSDAGARLDIVSDWPGSYNEQRATPLDPLENIALAMTRQSPDGSPAGGWHPDQRLTVKEAIAAYTLTPAHAAYEEDRKGSIAVGKLADLVVLSKDILGASAADIRTTHVDLTILGGRTIYAG